MLPYPGSARGGAVLLAADAAIGGGGSSMLGQCPSCGDSASFSSFPATCTGKGSYSWSCSHCGYKDSGTTPALGHKYGSYVETSAPTCTSAGVETATCSRCGDTKTRTGDAALGHNPVSDDTAATCTSSGTSGRKVCSDVKRYDGIRIGSQLQLDDDVICDVYLGRYPTRRLLPLRRYDDAFDVRFGT